MEVREGGETSFLWDRLPQEENFPVWVAGFLRSQSARCRSPGRSICWLLPSQGTLEIELSSS